MNFVEDLLKKAKAANKTIVLCEGEDKRVVEAASKMSNVLYNLDQVISLCRELHIASFQATGVRPHLALGYNFIIA